MSEDFSVTALFQLDKESVSRAGKNLQTTFGAAAGNIANSFKGRLLAAVGAGGVMAVLTKQLTKGFETMRDARKSGLGVEEFETLKRLSDQTGASVDELAQKYLTAKQVGGAFATEVQGAMKDLLSRGIITGAEQVDQLAEAFIKLSDVLAKLAPVAASGTSAVAATVEKSLSGGFWENLANGATVSIGRINEALGNVSQRWTGYGKGLSEMGLRQQMAGYGLGNAPFAQETAPGRPGGPSPAKSGGNAWRALLESTVKEMELEAWFKSIGGRDSWSSSSEKAKSAPKAGDVSDLRQIGGYMSRGPSTTAAEEQLRLINRKMDDLVSTGKALTL